MLFYSYIRACKSLAQQRLVGSSNASIQWEPSCLDRSHIPFHHLLDSLLLVDALWIAWGNVNPQIDSIFTLVNLLLANLFTSSVRIIYYSVSIAWSNQNFVWTNRSRVTFLDVAEVITFLETHLNLWVGTRLYEGKDYFTILDFVKAYQLFSDPEWDDEPPEPEIIDNPPLGGKPEQTGRKKIHLPTSQMVHLWVLNSSRNCSMANCQNMWWMRLNFGSSGVHPAPVVSCSRALKEGFWCSTVGRDAKDH